MVGPIVESVSWTLVWAVDVASSSEGTEVFQKAETSQTTFRGYLVAMNASTGIERSANSVHWPIHLIARSITVRMSVAGSVIVLVNKQLLKILLNGATQVGSFTPRFQRVHTSTKVGCRFGSIDVPHTLMQVMVFAATVADFQKAVQKTQQQNDLRVFPAHPQCPSCRKRRSWGATCRRRHWF